MAETKQCTKCKEVKPLERFSRTHKDQPTRQSICKDCDNKAKRDRHAAFRAKNPLPPRQSPEERHAAKLSGMRDLRERRVSADPEGFRAEQATKTADRRARLKREIRVAALVDFAKVYEEQRKAGASLEEAVELAADWVPAQWDYKSVNG
jgi:hypothetical protein